MCRIGAFSPKNLPKGRNFTYLEDPGKTYVVSRLCIYHPLLPWWMGYKKNTALIGSMYIYIYISASVKTPYVGDGHLTFNDGIVTLLLG